jgi:squalene monooxygenase
VLGYGIFQGDTMLQLDYPSDPRGNGRVLEGRAFHNGRLLMSLRAAVTKQRTAELRQGKVMELLEDRPGGRVIGVSYRTKDSDEVQHLKAPLTVVCDGLFSSLNKTLTENVGQQRSSFLGLILRNAPYPLPNGAGHVILADPTPILLYPISSTEGRMLVDFPPGTLPTNKEDVKKHLLTHTRMQLPASMRDAFAAAVEEGWTTMPNRQMGARPVARPGTLLLGDALNVRHPLTGGGMTVAFTDVQNVLRVLDEGLNDWNDNRSIDELIKSHYSSRGAPVAAINILADALYDVFGQKYSSLRAACFSYLSEGGEKSAGPIRLLSGVSRSQALLVYHFFSVALWGCAQQLVFSLPTPSAFVRSFLMLRDANIIILPLLLQEHPSFPFQCLAALLRTVFWIPRNSYVKPRPKQ